MKKAIVRANVGEVFEIKTPNGYGYFQITHIHSERPKFGHLIRVVGEFESQQNNAAALASMPTKFKIFFPAADALKKGLIRGTGSADIPKEDIAFPLFRNGTRDPKTKQISDWWLWDGTKEWRVGKLSKEQYSLPQLAVINDTLLAQRIAEGWTNESYR